MGTKKTFIQKHSVLLYFILTFALSWGCMVGMVGPEGFPLTPEKMEEFGPMVYVGLLIGPSVSALLLTGLESGRAGFRELWARLSKWRVGLGWYALALLATPLLAVIVLLALSLFSPDFFPGLFTTEDKRTLLMTGIGVGVFVGIFEELGWIGFVVPRMRRKYSTLATGMIVGVLWGLWHFPPFWETNSFTSGLPFLLLVVRLLAWLPPYRVLMVWVYDHTQSLLVTILMHASLDFSMLVFPSIVLSGWTLIVWIVTWGMVLWGCVWLISKKVVRTASQTALQEQLT